MKQVTVKAPATIANLVCGFDILGLCLQEPFDIMEVSLLDERKIIIESEGELQVPEDPRLNTAGVPLMDMLNEIDETVGFALKIHKKIKPGSGLGSSAASAAGAVVAANALLGNRFSKPDLVRFAMSGEKLATGVKHADNLAPAIYGGTTLIRCIFPLDIVSIPTPSIYLTVVHPQIEVKTADSRQILRKEVQLKDAIRQWGNIAGLVAGLMSNDYDLIGRSLEDTIIEPLRSILIPEFDKIKQRCISAGALGGGISGSGPSIFMMSRERETALQIEQIMKQVYSSVSLPHLTYVTTVNPTGCTIIDQQ